MEEATSKLKSEGVSQVKGKNVPDERCICSTSESAGTVLLTPEVLHAWKVEGNMRNAKRSSQSASRDGPHEPWTSSKDNEKPWQGLSRGDMIRLVLQRGWKSNCEGSRQEAEGPEGRLHRRAQARDDGI